MKLAPFSLRFELVTKEGNSFMLFFGTRHEMGVDRMMEAMWKVDSYGGGRFRDPLFPQQLPLALEAGPSSRALGEIVRDHLEDGGKMILQTLKRFTLLETILRPTHTKLAVNLLEAEGIVDLWRAREHDGYIVSPADPTLF